MGTECVWLEHDIYFGEPGTPGTKLSHNVSAVIDPKGEVIPSITGNSDCRLDPNAYPPMFGFTCYAASVPGGQYSLGVLLVSETQAAPQLKSLLFPRGPGTRNTGISN